MLSMAPTIIPVPSMHLEQAKKHVFKPWMSNRGYHERIQKKWLKRYGKVWVDTLPRGKVVTGSLTNTIICREDDEQEVRSTLLSVWPILVGVDYA